MSDTEDARDIKKMTDDGFIYQLRKIGPDASCSKVPRVMRLNLGLTKIGRGQHNDYFLDSAVLKNFISRSHVEIIGKKNENGEIEFSMTDKGLNGTFVNDYRTQRTCILEINDKITFGHTNGYKIEPGSYAEQPKSEFQFIFEKLPISCKTTEVCDDFKEEEPPESPPIEPKKESGVDRSFLSDLQSNTHVQKSSKPTKSTHNSRNRKDSDSVSDSDDKVITDTKPKGSKRSGKSEKPSKRSPKKVEPSSSRRKSSSGSVNKFSETLPALDSDDDDDDENSKDEVEDDDDNVDDDKNDAKSKDSEDNNSKSESDDDEKEEEEIPKKKRKLPQRKTAPQSTQRKGPLKGKKVVKPDSSSESESSSDNESSKPEADQRPKQTQKTNKQKVSRAVLVPKQKKRPSSGNSAPTSGNKRPRRAQQPSSAKTSATATASDLEPGVEWYDEDKCDSVSCKRPKKNRTPWVQCDDCDGWYHTVCVGANYNQLKDSDARFNCGCIS